MLTAGPLDGAVDRLRHHAHRGHEPDVADAVVVQPREILIDGKSAGTVSLIVWGADSDRHSTTWSSSRASRPCSSSCSSCFPGEDIRVSAERRGHHPVGAGVEQRRDAARRRDCAGAVQAKRNVINMLQLPGGRRASR